jgi:large subunit ribosomal protein L25
MAQKVQLKAKSRAEIGKGAVKRMRDQGTVPGVVYGAHMKPINITVGIEELEKALHSATSENVLVDLQLEEGGKTNNRLALIQEVQHHPYKDTILHIDLHEVLATEKLRASVPVRPIGEPAGVKNGGGVLEFVMRDLHVECLPQDLPALIEVNVEKLEIGQSIHVGDITPPKGVALLDDKGQTVFLVAAPITEEELAAMTEAAAAPSAEPEVLTAKKEEGEEGAVVEGEAKPKAEAGKADAKTPAAAGKADTKAPAAAGKADAKAPVAGKAPATGKAPAVGAAGKAEAKPSGGKPEAKK